MAMGLMTELSKNFATIYLILPSKVKNYHPLKSLYIYECMYVYMYVCMYVYIYSARNFSRILMFLIVLKTIIVRQWPSLSLGTTYYNKKLLKVRI
ncbi:putative Bracovirus protein MdBV-25 [Microplitis demolitor]